MFRSMVVVWMAAGAFQACERAAPPSPTPIDPSAVAYWDGGVVTENEVKVAVRKLGPGLREQFDSPGGRRQFIEALVAKRLLSNEARRRGLLENPQLRREVEELEERLLIQTLVDEESRAQAATEESVLRTYYTEHAESFRLPSAAHVGRVLIRKGANPAAARVRIDRLRQRITKGESLAKVAPEADGAERLNGGDVGWMDDASAPVSKVALALTKVGEVSAVVELDDSFVFVVLIERNASRVPPFEEVRERVRAKYTPIAQRHVFDRLVKRLKTEAGVEIKPAALE